MKTQELYQKLREQNYQYSIDTRTLQPGDIYFALRGDVHDGHEYIQEAHKKGASYVVIDDSALADGKSIIVDDVLESLQDLAHYHRMQFDIPIIGLTGSNGKTTTKELIAAVLGSEKNIVATDGNLNNHIGVPLTLLRIRPETEIAVIEMGANHVGEIKLLCDIAAPNYGLITNIGRAHIGLFEGFENIIRAKTELYRYIESHNGKVFIHGDNTILMSKRGKLEVEMYSSTQHDADLFVKPEKLFPFVSVFWGQRHVQTRLTGAYNVENITAAICVGNYFDIHPQAIEQSIESYVPRNERSEMIDINDGNTVIKDYYNANTSSMLLALENLISINTDQDKIAILGDMFEMGDYTEEEHRTVLEKALSLNLKHIYLAGEAFYEIALGKDNVSVCKTTDELVDVLRAQNIQNTLILIKASQGMGFKKVFEGMNNEMKIAIITGGSGPERITSLKSAKFIESQLHFADVKTFLYPEEFNTFIGDKGNFDIVIPLIHGNDGEDGLLQNLLSIEKVPFIFSDSKTQALCFHKQLCKEKVSLLGINVPETYSYYDIKETDFPIIAKPQKNGSSIGVYFIENRSELDILGDPEGYLYEEYITGREFTIGVVEKNNNFVALPVMEVIKGSKMFFDTHDKYSESAGDMEIFPKDLSADLEQRLKDLAVLVHKELGLRHLSRTDVILSEDGNIYFLEVNTIPGCTNDSFIPKMARAGLNFSELLQGWCESVLSK